MLVGDGAFSLHNPLLLMEDLLSPGNASQVSDGAAAVLLARRSVAKKLGLPIIGKYVSAAVVGVPPKIMGYVASRLSPSSNNPH
jgi:acetyl-CoA acyltransferase 1